MKQRNSLLALAGTMLTALTLPASADVITDWNLTTIQVSKGATNLNDGHTNPFTGAALNTNLASRIDAIESIAVYNAVNAIRQIGTPYGGYNVSAPSTASPEAAAAQAAHNVLVNYYPSQSGTLDSLLATSLNAIPNGQPKTDGIAAGAAAASHIIALRASDGSSPNATYPGPGSITPGAYQLTPNVPPATTPPFTFNPGINQQWAGVTPFVLTSPSQFRPGPPPALNSAAYTQALSQVKTYGTPTNARHTAELEHITQFYKQDAEVLDNEAARLLSTSHNLDLEDNALLFVRLGTAIADTRIAEWDAKYFYLFWRPITALNADPSGAVTNNYAAWKPAIVTPNHPSYPSGHSGTVVAIEILRSYFGDFNSLTLHTTTAGEPARSVNSLTQIESENGLSRIYGGIHFAFDNSAGQALGQNVANYVLSHGPQQNP